jgi:hypothetical protein
MTASPDFRPKCHVCGHRHGRFWMVTYVDAPAGGVPVHRWCLQEFFRRLDAGWPVPTRARAARAIEQEQHT